LAKIKTTGLGKSFTNPTIKLFKAFTRAPLLKNLVMKIRSG